MHIRCAHYERIMKILCNTLLEIQCKCYEHNVNTTMKRLWKYHEHTMDLLWNTLKCNGHATEHCGNTMNILWAGYGNAMVMLWSYYGNTMTLLWSYYANTMTLPWKYYETTMNYCEKRWQHYEHKMNTLWNCYGNTMKRLWKHCEHTTKHALPKL